jgi:hypothetical protein
MEVVHGNDIKSSIPFSVLVVIFNFAFGGFWFFAGDGGQV